VSLAFGLCFGAPVLSGEVFNAHIVPHSCHPNHSHLIVKHSVRAENRITSVKLLMEDQTGDG
jgi:hypothetical protein